MNPLGIVTNIILSPPVESRVADLVGESEFHAHESNPSVVVVKKFWYILKCTCDGIVVVVGLTVMFSDVPFDALPSPALGLAEIEKVSDPFLFILSFKLNYTSPVDALHTTLPSVVMFGEKVPPDDGIVQDDGSIDKVGSNVGVIDGVGDGLGDGTTPIDTSTSNTQCSLGVGDGLILGVDDGGIDIDGVGDGTIPTDMSTSNTQCSLGVGDGLILGDGGGGDGVGDGAIPTDTSTSNTQCSLGVGDGLILGDGGGVGDDVGVGVGVGSIDAEGSGAIAFWDSDPA